MERTEHGYDGPSERDVRPGNPDARGGGPGGAGVGSSVDSDTVNGDGTADPGAIRSRIANLRATAAMVRAIEPSPIRRLTIALARAEGWPVSDVERLTLYEASWIARQRDEEAMARDRARHSAPRVRLRRGAR